MSKQHQLQQQKSPSSKMIFLNSSVQLGFLAFLLVSLVGPRLTVVLQAGASSHQSPSTSINNNNRNNNGNSAASAAINGSTNPHWRRPGCHRVGCVKFNLSTNACRGYCMSYSIPANEDHGPLAQTEFDHADAQSMATLSTPTSSVAGGKGAPLLMSRPSSNTPLSSEQQQRSPQLEQPQFEPVSNNRDASSEQQENRSDEASSFARRFATTTTTTGHPERPMIEGRENSLNREQQKLQQQIQSIGLSQNEASTSFNRLLDDGAPKSQQTSAAMGGGGGGGSSGQQSPNSIYSAPASDSEKREVVSISQCCNMMETEDVLVNLRCGASEIRRLVFKSAKTCECFFCKHV